MSSVRILITVVSLLLGVGFGYWMTQKNSVPAIETAMLYPAPVDLGDFSLVNANGESVDASYFEDDWQLVFFGFTFCPDICPMTLQVLSAARQSLADAGSTALPEIVLVSVDPERDTPEILSEYIAYFGDGVSGLTGDLGEIRKLTERLGIFFQKVELDEGNYTVDHSSVVLVISPAGQLVALFSAPHSAAAIAHDLRALLAS